MEGSTNRRDGPSLVVLTGAGISAESGVPTFRGPDGLWCGHAVEDVATAEAVQRDRAGVNRFFNMLRADAPKAQPNAAHEALVKLENAWPGPFLLVTQNIDGLHARAGSQNLIAMHGALDRAACDACGAAFDWHTALLPDTLCPLCGQRGLLRPDITLFNEMPKEMDRICTALLDCAFFVAIGTSGVVYPAAGFVDLANRAGAHTTEINAAETARSPAFEERLTGPAGMVVPAFVARLLRDQKDLLPTA